MSIFPYISTWSICGPGLPVTRSCIATVQATLPARTFFSFRRPASGLALLATMGRCGGGVEAGGFKKWSFRELNIWVSLLLGLSATDSRLKLSQLFSALYPSVPKAWENRSGLYFGVHEWRVTTPSHPPNHPKLSIIFMGKPVIFTPWAATDLAKAKAKSWCFAASRGMFFVAVVELSGYYQKFIWVFLKIGESRNHPCLILYGIF